MQRTFRFVRRVAVDLGGHHLRRTDLARVRGEGVPVEHHGVGGPPHRAGAGESRWFVTSFIRAAALEATSPVDCAALVELARDLERRAHQVVEFVARGA